ncbi:hypothetical protein [Brucella gallinifaecis]|uniref:hypothetical protein n=1 Tax=Brucella gallinifaecis TaxID=215590 RepID=UPI002363042B|nr:hypothetical protein [Brucella gallinifaecis]
MKNILKNTVAMPFKFIKGIFELMKALLNSILKLFGHPGLPSGGSHSAESQITEEALNKDETKPENDLVNKQSLEHVNKAVNQNSLETIKVYLTSKDRKPEQIATLSKNMRLYVSSLSSDKMAKMSKLNDHELKMLIHSDLKLLKQNQLQQLRHNNTKLNSQVDEQNSDENMNAKNNVLRKRIQARRNMSSNSHKMSFAM